MIDCKKFYFLNVIVVLNFVIIKNGDCIFFVLCNCYKEKILIWYVLFFLFIMNIEWFNLLWFLSI